MSEESDFDDDIDKLLDEIDSAGTQKKQGSSLAPGNESKPSGTGFSSLLSKAGSGTGQPKDDDNEDNLNGGAKLSLKSDGEIKVNYQSSGFKLSDFNRPPGSPIKEPPKSVRFPENPLPGSGPVGSLNQNQPQQSQSNQQPLSQPPRSSFLSNLLGKQPQDTTPGSSGPSSLKGPGSGTGTTGAKSDWLGIGASGNPESLSPPGSPTMTASASKRFGVGAGAPAGIGRSFGNLNDSTINFDDNTEDNEELLKAMGLDVSIKSKANKPQQPQRSTATTNPSTSTSTKPKIAGGGFELDDDFWPKKPAPGPATRAAAKGETDPPENPTSKLRSSLLSKGRDFHIEDSPFDISPQPKFTPSATSTPAPKSIVDVLPFLKPKPQSEPQVEQYQQQQQQYQPESFENNPERSVIVPASMRSLSPAPPHQPQPQRPPSTVPGKKKKVQQQASAVAPPPTASTPVPQIFHNAYMDPSRNTLLLPSHLVDEDELKSICNSLKSLYSTQLEMQEKSYQEQMECLMQSHSRKEDLLKDEIKIIHKEYDTRLGRLKDELHETETKFPQKLQSELATMKSLAEYHMQRAPFNSSMNFHNQLPSATAQELSSTTFANVNSPRGVHFQQQAHQDPSLNPKQIQQQNPNQSTNNPEITHNNSNSISANASLSIVHDLSKVLDDKINTILETVHHTTLSALKSEMSMKNERNSKEAKELAYKLDAMQKKFDSFAKYKLEEESRKSMLIIESDKKLQGEIAKLMKQQKKLKESVVKAAVASVSQTLQYNLDESSHKKDKIASQLKEFRKDVRRVLFDLESKNEVVQKSHVNIESDQKQIIETLRELQTLIQVNSARNLALTYSALPLHNNPNANANIQSVHTQQQLQQSEMEIKLLREERNSLSDSISHMNVERRKLNEEKISLERDKMDFEREKNRMRDLEVQLKIKIAEADDLKQQADQVRRVESSKTIESTMKLAEMEKERASLKEQYHTAEQRLRIREQKLIQEKTELMREKEFIEKLRDQLLCPGCMKSVHQFQLNCRSDGDGLDLSAYSNTDNASASSKFPLNSMDSKYFQKESLYLDDLFYKQFNAKQ